MRGVIILIFILVNRTLAQGIDSSFIRNSLGKNIFGLIVNGKNVKPSKKNIKGCGTFGDSKCGHIYITKINSLGIEFRTELNTKDSSIYEIVYSNKCKLKIIDIFEIGQKVDDSFIKENDKNFENKKGLISFDYKQFTIYLHYYNDCKCYRVYSIKEIIQ